MHAKECEEKMRDCTEFQTLPLGNMEKETLNEKRFDRRTTEV